MSQKGIKREREIWKEWQCKQKREEKEKSWRQKSSILKLKTQKLRDGQRK